MVEVDFISVGSPHIVPGITFPKNCSSKAELTTLGLQKQPLSDPCESFEGCGQLN